MHSPKPKGFTLLELLISLFILSITLISIFTTSTHLLQKSRGNLYYQRATLQAENMASYLHAHAGVSSHYLNSWRQEINSSLPSGNGRVTADAAGQHISITWGKANSSCINQSGISGCVSKLIKL